jgi:hypothetical protein
MKRRFMNAYTLREKFATPAGREAFDRMNALGDPRWCYVGDGDRAGKVSLWPTVEIKDGAMSVSVDGGSGRTPDEAIISFEKALKRGASETGMSVVTRSAGGAKKYFGYNNASDTFTPVPKA